MVGDHPIVLRGLTFDGGSGQPRPATEGRPVLLERTDEDFVSAFLEELSSDSGRALLKGSVLNAGEQDPALKLLQPVHRSFHLALFEAVCEVPGEPRVDPARIESAGLVVRRLQAASGPREGWMRLKGEVRGWVPLKDPLAEKRDPSPERRGTAIPAGHPTLNTLVESALGAPEPYEESVSLLFVAPPHVCAAARRTLLYGLVPVASSELVSGRSAPAPAYEESELREHLAPYFSESVSISLQGIAGKTYSSRFLEEARADWTLPDAEREPAAQRLEQFATMLARLVSIFNAFAPDSAMRQALNGLRFEYEEPHGQRPVGDALAEAFEVFVRGNTDVRFRMPARWPRLTAAQVAALVRAASTASTGRMGKLLPRPGRFDQPGARYEVRGFVRVRRDDGCPPRLFWSEPSQPFAIAAWHESGKLPPVQVALPPVTRNNVHQFLPNVAFHVPGDIFGLLSRNKAKDFLEEKAQPGSGGLDWICGFNIPLITLCAFIVLSIFLTLLHIIFWWLPFIKICIPLPRRARSS
jgi:hypothetical protein